MKQTVAKELQSQNFTTYYEPLDSPYRNLWWDCFRPDVLAVRYCNGDQKVVLVECETKPNKKRMLKKTAKIRRNLSLQKRLYKRAHIFPLLVIPPFNLSKVLCSEIRRFWDIWIVNRLGETRHKISRKMRAH